MSARADRRGLGARPVLSRRGFVQGSLAAYAGARVPRLARHRSDELAVAVVGLNGRGAAHVEALRALPGVRIVALCDVDEFVLGRELRRLRERGGSASAETDFRRLLERTDLDAVTLATPDHWHALQTIWACQAEKDVYVESPVTHTFAEGARVVTAARKHGRIVQSGLQARSSPALAAAIEWLRAGNLGALELARALDYDPRPSIGTTKGAKRVPEVVDYDLWCGPGPLLPLQRAKLHRDWRWLYAYGEGELGSGAAHVLDIARWVAGAEGLPASVLALGGRFGYADDGETPNTQLVHYAFEPVPILLEVRGLPRNSAARAGDWAAAMDDTLGVRVGVVVHCAHGTLRIHGEQLAIACDDEGREIRRWEGAGEPFANWVAALRSRRVADQHAGIEVGARTSGLVHLASISQRLGRKRVRDDLLAELDKRAVLTATAERMFAHLDQNGVDLLTTEVDLGPRLTLDQERGTFKDDARADKLLAGSYRAPFVLPPV